MTNRSRGEISSLSNRDRRQEKTEEDLVREAVAATHRNSDETSGEDLTQIYFKPNPKSTIKTAPPTDLKPNTNSPSLPGV
ncbi:hypothetical protein Bca4012_031377 [Brassica carinata]|uniref:Uncharacterized protein n=1 Tax=Brassica carinata TaxID=52824 RepID=A0A8X7RER6_BRACI|nr:hypothetical protein Bca52824_047413 [Brassica carinata]